MRTMSKAKATEHTVVVRSVHDSRVPMPSKDKKRVLALIRSSKK